MSSRLTLLIALCLTLLACGSSSSAPSAVAAGRQSADTSSAASAPASATARPSPTLAVAAPCTKRDMTLDPAKPELTGPWLGDDTGIYYIRQIGSTIWWNGMSGQAGPAADFGRQWNNVATGQIKDDLTIELDWADVPRGGILGGGTLVWKIVDNGPGSTKLVKQSETGSGFGARVLTPCAAR